MAIIAHVSTRGGESFQEVFRGRKSPTVWRSEDVLDFARQMRSLIAGDGRWRWSLETNARDAQLVVESAAGTARSGPLRLAKDVVDQLGPGFNGETTVTRDRH
jgi:hypothetical protein